MGYIDTGIAYYMCRASSWNMCIYIYIRAQIFHIIYSSEYMHTMMIWANMEDIE